MTGEAPDDAGLAAPVARDARLALGVVVERSRAATPWQEYVWLPVGVVVGSPLREPWAMMHEDPHATQFFAGEYEIELTPRETGNYQVNLAAEQPAVYVVLRFEDGAAWLRQERPFGQFARVVTLPSLVDADKVEATYELGVLRLTLPKSEVAKPRKISVRGA